MRDFFVQRDMLIYSHKMSAPSDFSARGFSGGQSEDTSALAVTVSSAELYDEFWDNVVFMMQDSISDEKLHALTVYGNTAVTDAGVLFDGSGDYITSVYNDDFNLSGSDFTLECIAKPSAFTSGAQDLIQKDGVNGQSYCQYGLAISSGKKAMLVIGDGNGIAGVVVITGTTILEAGTEYHIAGTCRGTTIRLFVNGVLEASGTKKTMTNSTTKPLYIGYQQGQPVSSYYRGLLRYVRITKGVARYIANFEPPTYPLPKS